MLYQTLQETLLEDQAILTTDVIARRDAHLMVAGFLVEGNGGLVRGAYRQANGGHVHSLFGSCEQTLAQPDKTPIRCHPEGDNPTGTLIQARIICLS